jgi:hypothetical protein
VDLEKLARRCRTVGVEVVVDGIVVRARTTPPGSTTQPPPKSGTTAKVTAGRGSGKGKDKSERSGSTGE